MKVVKSLLLGSAAGLLTVAGAQAADLPTRKAAPINYVRICDAYGAGFFYIPGTETCLKVGGLALFEARIFNTPYSISSGFFSASTAAGLVAGLGPVPFFTPGQFPGAASYRNPRARDNYGLGALGRLELDARTATGYGTLRAFIRVDSSFGTSSTSQTGALNQLYNTTAGPFPAKEQTIVNKAFVQFAGLTAGRAQSMFDFYADAYNYEALRGSNASPVLLAYTYTFGGPFTGFSATISAEDGVSRREQIGSVTSLAAVGAPTFIGGVSLAGFGVAGAGGPAFGAVQAGQQIPDLVANLRVDQPWGSAQLSGAAHQLRTTLYPTVGVATIGVFGAGPGATTGNPLAGNLGPFGAAVPTLAFSTSPAASQNDWGFAVQGAIKVNAPWIAPGDVFYLQATYEHGAVGYITGNTLAYTGGFWASSLNYGNGLAATPSSNGWVEATFSDCVWTPLNKCEKQQGGALVAAFKHYWLPTWSSAFYGSAMAIRYNADVNTPTFRNVLGVPNYKELRAGTNLVWTPVTGFDIGAEFMYTRGITDKPFGLSNDLVMALVGLPRFQSTSNVYEGRLRVQRAF
jgi:Porin subfamily